MEEDDEDEVLELAERESESGSDDDGQEQSSEREEEEEERSDEASSVSCSEDDALDEEEEEEGGQDESSDPANRRKEVGSEHTVDAVLEREAAVPTKGAFFMHDDRMGSTRKPPPPRRAPKKEEMMWSHDKFEELMREEEDLAARGRSGEFGRGRGGGKGGRGERGRRSGGKGYGKGDAVQNPSASAPASSGRSSRVGDGRASSTPKSTAPAQRRPVSADQTVAPVRGQGRGRGGSGKVVQRDSGKDAPAAPKGVGQTVRASTMPLANAPTKALAEMEAAPACAHMAAPRESTDGVIMTSIEQSKAATGVRPSCDSGMRATPARRAAMATPNHGKLNSAAASFEPQYARMSPAAMGAMPPPAIAACGTTSPGATVSADAMQAWAAGGMMAAYAPHLFGADSSHGYAPEYAPDYADMGAHYYTDATLSRDAQMNGSMGNGMGVAMTAHLGMGQQFMEGAYVGDHGGSELASPVAFHHTDGLFTPEHMTRLQREQKGAGINPRPNLELNIDGYSLNTTQMGMSVLVPTGTRRVTIEKPSDT